MTDGTEAFGRALDGFEAVLRELTETQWTLPTPCDPWTVRDVVGHVIGGVEWAAALITGSGTVDTLRADGFSDPGTLAGAVPLEAWASGRAQLSAAVETTEEDKLLSWPFGEQTVDTGLEWFSLEILVHTWDVGTATGHQVRLDPVLVHGHLIRLRPVSRYLRGAGAYGPELVPPAGADEQAQLIAFLGRRGLPGET